MTGDEVLLTGVRFVVLAVTENAISLGDEQGGTGFVTDTVTRIAVLDEIQKWRRAGFGVHFALARIARASR